MGTVSATHTDGPLVDPIEFPGSDNRTCGTLDDNLGQVWDFEFKIDEGNPNGTYEQGDPGVVVTPNVPTDFSVTITTTNDVMSWSSNLPVLGVYVKGGSVGGHLYNYSTLDFPVTHDNGLTVMPDDDGKLFGVSHISFCFDEPPRLPDVSIAKMTSTPVITAGDQASYTITLTNDGDADATGVMLTDTLPAGVAWTESSTDCTITGQALSCGPLTIGKDGGTFSVTVTGTSSTSACPSISNWASFTSDNAGSGDTESTPTIITVNCPVLAVDKTPNAGIATSGDTTGFTIVTTNNGPGTAKAVSLSDPLPAVASGWTVSAENWAGDCTITGAAGATQGLSCGPEDLAQGASRSVTVQTSLAHTDCDVLNNKATADGSNTQPAEDTGSINPLCPLINVAKTPDAGTVNAPGTATFSIVTTNGGDGEARATTLFDDLPEVAGGWDIVEADTDWASCSISTALVDVDGDTVLDDIGEWLSCGPENIDPLGGDDTRTVKVSASVTTDDCGPLPNLAEVTTSNDGSDSDEGLITVLCPELGIAKTTETPEVNAGEDVEYTITVTNSGDGPANDVVVTDDDLPGGITWAETSSACSIGLDGTLTCGPMTIAANSSFSVTLTGTTDAGECPSIENTASFVSSNAGNGSTMQTPTEIVVNCPDLEVEKGGSDVVVAGDEVEFTITVTNNGDGDAKSVVLTDNLPPLGSGTWEVTAVVGIGMDDCTILSDVLTCSLDELAKGASFSVTLSAMSDSDDCPGLENDASVVASNEPTDAATQDDNEDGHSITVSCPDTSIAKEATTGAVNADDEAVFTITVTAGGSGENENVTLTDQLIGDDADWSFEVSGDGADEDCSIDETAFLLCEFGNLNPGQSVTVELTYQTSSGDCPSIANTASVTATDDVDLTDNESDEVEITVNCPDVSVDKEPVETPISAGEQGQFTLEVSNAGPGAAYGVVVEDEPEAGTVWTVLDDGGFDCGDDVVTDQQTLTCTLNVLVAGGSATILIGYDTTADDCGVLDNAVTVTAGNEPAGKAANNSDDASIVVECPGLNLTKTADADPIDAGEEASFTIHVWNSGPGEAFDVRLHDDLPIGLAWDFEVVSGDAIDDDCDVASSMSVGGLEQMSIDCDFGTLGVTTMEGGIVIRVFADTERADCGLLENEAWSDASNDDRVDADDTLLVKCPEIALEKENDTDGPVLPGTEVTYTLTVTVSDGPAEDVTVVDLLPDGLEDPTDISNGGVYNGTAGTITWNLGDLADGEYTLTYQAVVSDDAAHGTQLVNTAEATSPNSQCPDAETIGPECEDDSTVTVRVPTLVIDKVADTEVIAITGPANNLVATPSVVTWTLTYTLTNGPVTNAVITDEVPVGFEFLDASDGGTFADGTVTWTFPTLSASGSVTFRTTVDPETISRTAPTVNVAVIDSDETDEDEGEDSVRVTVEPPVLGGNPTPRPPLPNTATGTGLDGEPITVPIELLVALFLGSLGAMALANVKARSRRR